MSPAHPGPGEAAPPPSGEADRIAPGETRRRWGAAVAFALVLFCVYQTLTLTDITDDVIRLGIEADSYQMIWASIAWITAMLFGFFLAATMTGRYGSRITLIAGLALFALGNLLCGMAVSLTTMIIARGVEGLGKGLATLSGRSSLYLQFDRKLIFAIGFYGVFAYATRYASPMLAAVLNDQLSWRWVYWGNVPLALAAVVAVLLSFKPNRPAAPRPLRLNWAIIGLSLTWVTAMVLVTGWYRRWGGWGSNWFAGMMALNVLCPVALSSLLLSGSRPGGHLKRLMGSRAYILAMMVRMLMLVPMSAVLSIMGQYLVEARGYPRPLAGWIMVPAAFTMAFSTILTTAWHRRSLRHAWLVVGVVGCSGSLWWMASIDNFTPKETLTSMLATWGLFLGLLPPVFLTDEVEGQNREDAAFGAGISLALMFVSLVTIPTMTKLSIKAWTDRAQDTIRLDIRPNRPAVQDTSARILDYYRRNGLSDGDASSATGHLLGEYVERESAVQGIRWGLQSLSLIMLGLGMLIALPLWRVGRGLRAPPGSGYS